MHSVDIGVGGDDNLVVTESLDAVLDVEGGLKQVEFVILVDHLTRHSVRVERLAAQGEDSLGLGVADLGDCAGGGITLGYENGRFLTSVIACVGAHWVVEVYAAVAQLAVVQTHFLGLLAGYLGYAGHGLALFFAAGYLLQHQLCRVGVFVKIVVEFLLDEVSHKLIDGQLTVGGHGLAAEFRLGLRLEHRFLDADRHRRDHAGTDVGKFITLPGEFLDGAAHMFAECGEMCPSLGGVLSVDE